MIWLTRADAAAPSLPATWLIATDARPAHLTERSLLRREMGRVIVSHQLGLMIEEIAIGHDDRGRPLLLRPADTGLHLSLATRAGVIAVALARQPVGVDVELVDTRAAPPLDVLHPGERAMLQALPKSERPLAFARIWSAKEAYVKALGTGFARAPESFVIALSGENDVSIDDPKRPGAITGLSRIIENGGQESLAAAVVVLDGADDVSPARPPASS